MIVKTFSFNNKYIKFSVGNYGLSFWFVGSTACQTVANLQHIEIILCYNHSSIS